ncbi:MAG: hypothetical protein K0S07_159 [Chlamydiales bacterium]|nr:hypothetical protein [Chlamydiales bacterium]
MSAISNQKKTMLPKQLEEEEASAPFRYYSSKEEEIFRPPYSFQEEKASLEEEEEIEEEKESSSHFELHLKAISFLLAGAFFLMFGLILALFSTDGKLTLSWNSQYWLFYLLGALPLLWFGWSALQRIEESE